MTRPVSGSLLGSSDPALRAVVVGDAAAIVGLGLAALGLLRSGTLESSVPDAIASIMIGILLAVTAFGLARPVADLLVDELCRPTDWLTGPRSSQATQPSTRC